MRSKYHFAEYKITELANCSKKGRVEICVMKSQIRKQSLSKLLSSYYLKIYSLYTMGPYGLPNVTLQSRDNSVSKLFQEGKDGTLCDEVTHQKAISQKASL